MTRDAALAMREVITYDSCVERFAETWARCDDMLYCASTGSFCDDFVLSWAAHACELPIVEHAEVRSRWRSTPSNLDLRYAVTHPHKLR